MNGTSLKNVSTHIEYYRKAIEAAGFEVFTSTSMGKFLETRQSLGGYVHNTLSSDVNFLSSDNSFWVGVSNPRGEIVACAAGRMYENVDLVHLLHSRRIWDNRCLESGYIEPLAGCDEGKLSEVSGRISIHGGLFVGQETRGKKVGMNLIHLVRAMSFRFWFEDWHFGLITEDTFRRNTHLDYYGYHRAARAFFEKPSWGPRNDVEYVNYSSRSDMLAAYSTSPVNFSRSI